MIEMVDLNKETEENTIIIDKDFLEEYSYGEIAKYLSVGTVFDYKYLIEKTEDEQYFFGSTETIYRGLVFELENSKYGFPNGRFYTTEQNNCSPFNLKDQLLFVEQGYCEITLRISGFNNEK